MHVDGMHFDGVHFVGVHFDGVHCFVLARDFRINFLTLSLTKCKEKTSQDTSSGLSSQPLVNELGSVRVCGGQFCVGWLEVVGTGFCDRGSKPGDWLLLSKELRDWEAPIASQT